MLKLDNLEQLTIAIVFFLVVSAGYWKVFMKCGVAGYWGFVPFAREYHLGLCADCEEEGRNYTILTVISAIANGLNLLNPDNLLFRVLLLIAFFVLAIATVI